MMKVISPLALEERVMCEVALSHPDVLKDGEEYEPLFPVAEFGDSAIQVLIIFWVADARRQWGARSDITRGIERRFKQEGIVIPFPQRDVWTRQRSEPDRGEHRPSSSEDRGDPGTGEGGRPRRGG